MPRPGLEPVTLDLGTRVECFTVYFSYPSPLRVMMGFVVKLLQLSGFRIIMRTFRKEVLSERDLRDVV
jgi:hypothetical protein